MAVTSNRLPRLEVVAPPENIQIFRDEYGTPHVVADSNYGVYFGYGYAVATDRMFQMEMLRRTVEGKVSEVMGGDFLELDKHIRSGFDHRAVKKQLSALERSDLEILEGYADGFSKRVRHVLREKDTLMAREFTEFGFVPQEWTAYDVAMIFIGSIAHRYSDFNSELDNWVWLIKLSRIAWSRTKPGQYSMPQSGWSIRVRQPPFRGLKNPQPGKPRNHLLI